MITMRRKTQSSGPEPYIPGPDDTRECGNCRCLTRPQDPYCDQCAESLPAAGNYHHVTDDGPVTCPEDGHGNAVDARACGQCGRVLPGSAHAAAFNSEVPVAEAQMPYSSSGRRPGEMHERLGFDPSPQGRASYFASPLSVTDRDDSPRFGEDTGLIGDLGDAERLRDRRQADHDEAAHAVRMASADVDAEPANRAAAAYLVDCQQRARETERLLDEATLVMSGLTAGYESIGTLGTVLPLPDLSGDDHCQNCGRAY